MMDAATKNDRILEIGYQRNYNPVYRTAYEGVMKTGALGEIYQVRLAWAQERQLAPQGGRAEGRRLRRSTATPPGTTSITGGCTGSTREGLFAELGSHQVNAANWFLGAVPGKVQAMGGVYRFKDGREVPDHVYATFEYPGGITGTFASGESNAFEERYEIFYGTKGTLIMRNENEAMLFDEGDGAARPDRRSKRRRKDRARCSRPRRPSRSRPAAGAARTRGRGADRRRRRDLAEHLRDQRVLFRHPVATRPLNCGPEQASHSASWTIAANEALKSGTTGHHPHDAQSS